MEFSNEVSHSINNKPSQFRGDKSKCIIDGMINLTGKGERLGVAKFNCSWGNAAGRVQARRVDTVRYLLIYHALGLYLYNISVENKHRNDYGLNFRKIFDLRFLMVVERLEH